MRLDVVASSDQTWQVETNDDIIYLHGDANTQLRNYRFGGQLPYAWSSKMAEFISEY
jgi:hypothetical protein